jgi:hypothetical protein
MYFINSQENGDLYEPLIWRISSASMPRNHP